MVLENILTILSHNLVLNIGILIMGATLLGILARYFKQPLIPAYITIGIILGPIGLGFIQDLELIKKLAEIGIAFLLFVIGLEIDVKKLREVGITVIITGLIQTILVFIIGYIITINLGFDPIVAIYLGLIAAFSSTMVVVKLLADNDEIHTLHGRIILGILLVQDIIAMIALAALSTPTPFINIQLLTTIIVKSLMIVGIGYLITRFVNHRLFHFAARSNELLFLCSITMCFLFATIASLLGFSIAIGAFVAGMSLATLPYATDIKGRVVPIKDFFATLFFIALGSQLVFTGLDKLIQPTLIILAIIIIIKPFVIFLLTTLAGYGSKVAFLTGNSLLQVSEFSFILVSEGLILGHVNQKIFSITIILAIITMIITSYVIKHAHNMHQKVGKLLHPFNKLALRKREIGYSTQEHTKKIVLIGCSRMGTIFIETLQKLHKNILVIDNNPEIIMQLMKRKIQCKYGDGTSREVLESINLEDTTVVIATIPNIEDNEFILEYVKNSNEKCKVILLARHVSESFRLYDLGADYVIVPHVISGEKISAVLQEYLTKKRDLGTVRKEHVKQLEYLESLDMN